MTSSLCLQEMPNLPEEVIEEILSRLPVDSLIRFKCVCKWWFALFTDPNFVSKHMRNQSKDNLFLHRFCPEKGNVFHLLSLDGNIDHNRFCIKDFTFNLELKYTDEDDDDDVQKLVMHGHCDGIVALSNIDEEIVLWNPALREFRFLPESDMCSDALGEGLENKRGCVGFGYDPKTDDYKVVRIVDFVGLTQPIRYPSRAEVFSLRGDSTWREIDNADMGADPFSNDDLEQFFDGVYYWRALDPTTHELVLVSFDMADEVFSRAPMPDFCQVDYSSRNENETLITCLGVFNNESIALFSHPFHGTCIEVWVMKESWMKQLTIGPLQGLERALVFWKNDKELLQEDINGQLVFYNLATMGRHNLSIRGVVKAPDIWTAAAYKKTLVSVNAGKEIAA